MTKLRSEILDASRLFQSKDTIELKARIAQASSGLKMISGQRQSDSKEIDFSPAKDAHVLLYGYWTAFCHEVLPKVTESLSRKNTENYTRSIEPVADEQPIDKNNQTRILLSQILRQEFRETSVNVARDFIKLPEQLDMSDLFCSWNETMYDVSDDSKTRVVGVTNRFLSGSVTYSNWTSAYIATLGLLANKHPAKHEDLILEPKQLDSLLFGVARSISIYDLLTAEQGLFDYNNSETPDSSPTSSYKSIRPNRSYFCLQETQRPESNSKVTIRYSCPVTGITPASRLSTYGLASKMDTFKQPHLGCPWSNLPSSIRTENLTAVTKLATKIHNQI